MIMAKLIIRGREEGTCRIGETHLMASLMGEKEIRGGEKNIVLGFILYCQMGFKEKNPFYSKCFNISCSNINY